MRRSTLCARISHLSWSCAALDCCCFTKNTLKPRILTSTACGRRVTKCGRWPIRCLPRVTVPVYCDTIQATSPLMITTPTFSSHSNVSFFVKRIHVCWFVEYEPLDDVQKLESREFVTHTHIDTLTCTLGVFPFSRAAREF